MAEEINKPTEANQVNHVEDLKNSFKKHIRKTLIFVVILLLITGVSFGSYKAYQTYTNNQKNLYATIQKQNKQAADLAAQLNSLKANDTAVQQQNTSDVQNLKSQLDEQKIEAQKAQDQAQIAQKALSAVKQQPASQTTVKVSNTLPSINTRAIILIACFDSAGNESQSGSGTIITASGYVLTNKHVVTDSSGNILNCGAFMNDGSAAPTLQSNTIYSLSMTAANTGFADSYDAAVLKINAATDIKTGNDVALPGVFPYIMPHGGELKQGDTLFIFGYPAASNLVFNVSSGIVSSFTADNTFINTDAIIDHGNSGGAAITSDGRFVGIPTQKYYSQDGDYIGQILKVENLNLPN